MSKLRLTKRVLVLLAGFVFMVLLAVFSWYNMEPLYAVPVSVLVTGFFAWWFVKGEKRKYLKSLYIMLCIIGVLSLVCLYFSGVYITEPQRIGNTTKCFDDLGLGRKNRSLRPTNFIYFYRSYFMWDPEDIVKTTRNTFIVLSVVLLFFISVYTAADKIITEDKPSQHS